jgi:membrane-bound serine protease (ClpP class)
VKTALVRGFFLLLLAAGAALGSVGQAATATSGNRVLAVEFENDVNPVTRDFVEQQLDRAEREHYDAVAILLDTPGGLVSSMEDIVKAELASKVPVIVYVSPEGASATSAGAFIAEAADLLAMAPQTTIGSSTPVGSGGENLPPDLREKAVEKLSAQLRGLATDHGRNPDTGERAVRGGDSWTAEEALDQNVVDMLAPDLPTLLDKADGFKTKPKGLVLHTANADVDTAKMSLWQQVLDLLIDPNVVFLMVSIGLIGIIVELWNPGMIFPGTVGAISLVISLFAAQVLPVNWAGLLLMVLAAAFIGAEPFVASHGALAVAGTVCFILGGLLLFEPSGGVYDVSLPLILGVAAAMAGLIALVVVKLVQVRRRPVEVGANTMVGTMGVVRGEGLVFVNGELWRARADDGETLRIGDEVDVEGMDGLELIVRPRRVPAPA